MIEDSAEVWGERPRPDRIVLVLSGGNALGSFHAGVYEALAAAGSEPDWVIGASAGAITAALIAGNAPERRLERLRSFWRPDRTDVAPAPDVPWPSLWETSRRTAAVHWTLAAGRAGMFGPVGPLGSWWQDDPAAATLSLFDTRQMAENLAAHVEFDRLPARAPDLTITAVDLETGEDVVFEAGRDAIGPDHIRASAALPTAFPAIRIDGRALIDGGMSANLPLDPLFRRPFDGKTLCVAADLLPAHAPSPTSLGEVASRTQDIIFAAQSRRTIERWQAEHRLDPRAGQVTLARLVYSEQEEEVAEKALDFSPRSIAQRWRAGARSAETLIAAIAAGDVPLSEPGLSIWPK